MLANVAPYVLDGCCGRRARRERRPPQPDAAGGRPGEGQPLLPRLPRLRDASVDPAAAFGGTFHINESYSQLDAAYDDAAAGAIPDPLPCEIYCHSLTDPSILSPELRGVAAPTRSRVSALHVPDRLLDARTRTTRCAPRCSGGPAPRSNSVLAEPIEDAAAARMPTAGPASRPRPPSTSSTRCGMPGGNIFHGPLSWPFVEDDAAAVDTPAERWGVDSGYERILLCGSGAQRGGAVSGLGGHNAAMAVLEG